MVRKWLAVTVSAFALLYSTWAHADASFPPPPQYAAGVFAVLQQPVIGSGSLLAVPSSGDNGVLVTNGTGVPSITATLPTGLTIPSPTISNQITLTGLAPEILSIAPFGAWQPGTIDSGGPSPRYSDLVLAPLCAETTAQTCSSVMDDLYIVNNQNGLSSGAVTAHGSGYVTGNLVTLNTQGAAFTGSISGTTLTVPSAPTSGSIQVGQYIAQASPPTFILSQIDGTPGGAGDYQIPAGDTQTLGSTSLTGDDCIVRPVVQVTASGGQVTSVSVYAKGGRGRCLVNPSGALSSTALTGSGTGLTVTGTFIKNYPTVTIGQGGAGLAIATGYTPFALDVDAPFQYPEYGAIGLAINGTSTGPLLAVHNGSVIETQIDQSGNLDFFNNGSASTPLISLNGNGFHRDVSGALDMDIAGAVAAQLSAGTLNFPSNTYLAVGGTNVALLTPTSLQLQNGVSVSGAASYSLGSNTFAQVSSSLTYVQGVGGVTDIILGYSGFNKTLYDANEHDFRASGGGTVFVALNSSGFNLEVGVYESNGTAGVSCSGALSGSAVVTNGIVTHC
jgi:hypothetical protein